MVKRPHPLRAILLARVSTNHVEQANSPDRQLANLDEHCRRHGWPVVDRIVEKASGRQILDRPPVVRALERIFAYEADVLCVDHLSRLGRNAKEALEVLDLLHRVDAHLYDAHFKIDTTLPFGRYMFTNWTALLELETADRKIQIVKGLDRARLRGVKLGKPSRFGSAARARAVELRLAEKEDGGRYSWNEIRHQLEAEGLGKHSRSTISNAVLRALSDVTEPPAADGAA